MFPQNAPKDSLKCAKSRYTGQMLMNGWMNRIGSLTVIAEEDDRNLFVEPCVHGCVSNPRFKSILDVAQKTSPFVSFLTRLLRRLQYLPDILVRIADRGPVALSYPLRPVVTSDAPVGVDRAIRTQCAKVRKVHRPVILTEVAIR